MDATLNGRKYDDAPALETPLTLKESAALLRAEAALLRQALRLDARAGRLQADIDTFNRHLFKAFEKRHPELARKLVEVA